MKCLIVEDDSTAGKLLEAYLSEYCDCFAAVNGSEAIITFKDALEQGRPYELICLDIMMPEMDGHETLKQIRQIESEHGVKDSDIVKVIMTTAVSDPETVMNAFRTGCEAYIFKPVNKELLLEEMSKLGLPALTGK